MRARRRPARLVAALVAVSLGAAGCADPGVAPAGPPASSPSTTGVTTAAEPRPARPSTAEAFLDARTFALSAASARLEGTLPRGRRVAAVELEGTAAGADQAVVVDVEGAGVAEVVSVAGRHWLAGDVAFWRHRGKRPAEARAAAAGWHEVTGAQARRVAPWTLRTLLTDWFARADVAALGSDPLVVAQERSGPRELWVLGRPGGPRLWVAADGSGELVRLSLPGDAPTDVGFSGWGRVGAPAVPPADEVVGG